MDGEIMLKEVPAIGIAAVAVDRRGLTFDNMIEPLAEAFGTLAEGLKCPLLHEYESQRIYLLARSG